MVGFYIVLTLCVLGIVVGAIPRGRPSGMRPGESEGSYASRSGQYRVYRKSGGMSEAKSKMLDEYEANGWDLDGKFYCAD